MAPPRRQRLPRAIREQQMLAAATAVFSRRGYHAASMDEICQAAEISKPMFYLYLGSKEELFVACIRAEATRLSEVVSGAVDILLPPDEQLWQGVRSVFGFVHDHRRSWFVLFRQAVACGEPFAGEVAAVRLRMAEVVAALLTRAVEAEGSQLPTRAEMLAMAYSLVGMCEATADWLLEHPDASPDDAAQRVMNLCWMGFGNLLRGRVWRRDRDRGLPEPVSGPVAEPVTGPVGHLPAAHPGGPVPAPPTGSYS